MIVKSTKDKLKTYFTSIFTYIFIVVAVLILANNIGTKISGRFMLDTSAAIAIVLNIYVFILPVLIYLLEFNVFINKNVNEQLKTENKNTNKDKENKYKENKHKGIMPNLISIIIVLTIPFLILMLFDIFFLKNLFVLKKYIIAFIVNLIYAFLVSYSINFFNKVFENRKKENKKEFRFKNELILLVNMLVLLIYNVILNTIFGFKAFSNINIIYIKLMENLFNVINIFIIFLPVFLICFILKNYYKGMFKKENIKLKKNIINIFIVLAILVFFVLSIFLKDKVKLYMDFSKDKIYSLSKENKKKIKKVKKDIYVYYPGKEKDIYIKMLGENLKKANKKIKYIEKMPEIWKNDNKISDEYIYIIQKDSDIIYSISPNIEGKYLSNDKKEYKYLLEDKIVNGIITLDKEDKKKIEDKEAKIGFGILGSQIKLKEYETLIGKLSLKAEKMDPVVLEEKVPENIKLLIIPSVIEDISEKALNNLLDFGKKGGHFFIASGMTSIYENKTKNKSFTNYNKFLEEYGIKIHTSDIFERQNIDDVLERYKDQIKDLGEVENQYYIKADPVFNENGILSQLKNNSEKNEIFVASPIEILEKENVNVQSLAKTSKNSIEIFDREKYKKDVIDSRKELYEKVISDAISDEDLERILNEQNASEEERQKIKLLKSKDSNKMREERAKKIPKYDEKEFNIITKSELKNGDNISKMIYVSSDEIFYGVTSLNHENLTPPPVLLVYNQRLIYDIYEYLIYGDINVKKEETPLKFVKEISEEKFTKYKNGFNISIIAFMVIVLIGINAKNVIKTSEKIKEYKKDEEKEEKIN